MRDGTLSAVLPSFVRAAFVDGYKLAYKGMLAWSPIPEARNVPRVRLLFVALEATLGFIFWGMKPTPNYFHKGSFCPWPWVSFEYQGLCSHNALFDPIRANFDLTPEQLETIAAEFEDKERLRKAADYQRDKPKYIARAKAQYKRKKVECPKVLKDQSKRTRARIKADPAAYQKHEAS